MSTSGRQLLLVAIKGHRRVQRVLEGFLELGLPGATVIDAKGMGQIVSTELPIFSSFRALFPGGGEQSYLLLSVVREEQVEEAIPPVARRLRRLHAEGHRDRRHAPGHRVRGPGIARRSQIVDRRGVQSTATGGGGSGCSRT